MAFGTKRRKRNVAVDRRIDSRRERGRYNHYNYLAATVSLPRKRNREEEKEKKMEKKKMVEKWFGGCEQKMDITRKEKERGKSTANSSCIIAKRIGAMISVCLLFRSSFATKQLYALPTISTIFVAFVLFLSRSLLFPNRCFFSLSLSLPLSFATYVSGLARSSFSFACHFLLHFHQPLSLRPSPFFLFVILLSDSAIRQIAQTNDEPSGELFRTVYELLFPAPRVPGISES